MDVCGGPGGDNESLSMQDIQTLVEKGCPNTNWKTVNFGKRLRSHLQLHEGDVCDIVCVLLNYALDPSVGSDKKRSVAELVEAFAKKLLLELTELSDTRVDPELQNSAATVARKARSVELTEQDSELQTPMQFYEFLEKHSVLEMQNRGAKRVGTHDVEMKKGDWNCPQCLFMNFASNRECPS
ncbi:zinc finger protein VAR3, chloroplastic-like [Bidens hawaiensis]|uniref:zinc finger protein VAR3, chloroplastic-like n=1 Tax=Bidens hawaiensis TaxID=980011 RepID=UPI00404A62AF